MRARYPGATGGASSRSTATMLHCSPGRCEIVRMQLRPIALAALAVIATGCNTSDKKDRLPESAVVGTWRSDTLRGADASARVYQLQMAPDGMAEFTRTVVGAPVQTARGTWDGADSLVRVVLRGDATSSRPTSLLLSIHRTSLDLVEFDTTVWGPDGVRLHRR